MDARVAKSSGILLLERCGAALFSAFWVPITPRRAWCRCFAWPSPLPVGAGCSMGAERVASAARLPPREFRPSRRPMSGHGEARHLRSQAPVEDPCPHRRCCNEESFHEAVVKRRRCASVEASAATSHISVRPSVRMRLLAISRRGGTRLS